MIDLYVQAFKVALLTLLRASVAYYAVDICLLRPKCNLLMPISFQPHCIASILQAHAVPSISMAVTHGACCPISIAMISPELN